jgi:hypothetical protein
VLPGSDGSRRGHGFSVYGLFMLLRAVFGYGSSQHITKKSNITTYNKVLFPFCRRLLVVTSVYSMNSITITLVSRLLRSPSQLGSVGTQRPWSYY